MAPATNWNGLLQSRRAKKHQTSRSEINGLRAIVERDLQDASVQTLSPDRRFATAYNAALQLATIIVACAGYRVTGTGHPQTTFEGLEIVMGEPVAAYAAYFDACRRKRNQVDYTLAFVATETEVRQLLHQTRAFRQVVEDWLAANHPEMAA